MSMPTRPCFVSAGCMALLLVACSGNTSVGEDEAANLPPVPVALNQRLFDASSMTSLGSGCTTYQLKPGGADAVSGGGSAIGSSLEVKQKAVDYTVVVDVTDQGQQLAERIYDEDFFQSGKRDDFTVTSSTETMLLRFWAGLDADGHPQCAPLTDDGSQVPLP